MTWDLQPTYKLEPRNYNLAPSFFSKVKILSVLIRNYSKLDIELIPQYAILNETGSLS